LTTYVPNEYVDISSEKKRNKEKYNNIKENKIEK